MSGFISDSSGGGGAVPTGSAGGDLSGTYPNPTVAKFLGVTPGSGITTFIGTPTSANLATAVTDNTGDGYLVFSNAPSIASATLTGTITLPNGGSITSTGALSVTRTSLVVTSTDGGVFQNTTSAVVGNQVQYSPRVRWLGAAWNTTTGTSQAANWIAENRPGSGNPITSTFVFATSLNGGAYSDFLTLSPSTGYVFAPSFYAQGANGLYANAGPVVSNRQGITTTSTDAFIGQNITAATVGNQVQYSPRIRLTGAAWNTSGAISETDHVICELRPAAGNPTTSTLAWGFSIAAGAYADRMSLTSAGLFTSTIIQAARTSLAANTTDGIIATNTTAATIGTQIQYSPRLRWSGSAWNATSGVSETDNWICENRPATGNPTTSSLVWGFSINGGGYTDRMTLTSAGLLTVAGILSVNNAIGVTGASLYSSISNIQTTPQAGMSLSNPSSASGGTPNQWSPSFVWISNVYDGSASRQVNWRTEQQTSGSGGASYAGDLVSSYQSNGGSYTALFKLLGKGGIFLSDRGTDPAAPVAGAYLYSKGGVLYGMGTTGIPVALAT